MDFMISSDVETFVMDLTTPVNVAINPGREKTYIKDAVPPVQTSASKTNLVKLFLKQDKKVQFFHSSNFYRQCCL